MCKKLFILMMVMTLVVCIFAFGASAYNTTSRERLGDVNNVSSGTLMVWGILYPDGGTAELQICDYSGEYVYKTGTYPTYPTNPNATSCSIPSGAKRSLYANSPSGSQVWGRSNYGMG